MATYSQELDGALLPVPWLAKSDSKSKPYIMKYAPHPSKPGYVLLLTDLAKVYFEPLAGIRLLARQREVVEKYGQSQRAQDRGGSSLDIGGEEAVREVLDGVGEILGDELGEAEMEVSPGDLYDLDVWVKAGDTTWLFHMTEIRYGCLEIITRHMIHPLALSISSSRRPTNTTDDQIVELISSTQVLGAVNRHSSRQAPQRARKTPSPSKSKPGREEASESKGAGSSKEPLVRRGQDAPKKSSPESDKDTEDDVARSPSPTLKYRSSPSSRRSKGKGKSPERDKDARSRAREDDDDEEMMPEETSSPVPEPSSSRRTKHHFPSPVPPRSSRKKQDTTQDHSDEEMKDPSRSRSPSPPPPSAPSQKTQQEKDEEEEQALAKKREEMKRRMGAGGGGRLVRRRLG